VPTNVNLRQTYHAVERWRQRVHPHEGPSHIAIAFARAVLVEKNETLPFPKVPDTTYYRHATMPNIYFVTRGSETGERDQVLLTVTDANMIWGVLRDVPVRPQEPLDLPGPWVEPEHASVDAREAWLVEQVKRVVEKHEGFIQLSKNHPCRKEWCARRKMIERLLWEHRCDIPWEKRPK
jgi:hypothetical protein